jgi:hypothetical protein
MDPNLLSNGLPWIALAVFVIARQFMPRAIRPGVMIGLPVVIGFLGLRALAGTPPASAAAIALLAANLGLGAAMGIARGVTVRIWQDAVRGWMMQGTLITFAFWLVSIGLKVGLAIASHQTFSTSDIELLLAVTFGAQSLVVWARMAGALPAGMPVHSR